MCPALSKRFGFMSRFARSPELFARKRASASTAPMSFGLDDIDMSADTLRRLAQEQTGATYVAGRVQTLARTQGHTARCGSSCAWA